MGLSPSSRRKQLPLGNCRGRRGSIPNQRGAMALTNAPESEALTLDDITLFENGRQQVNVLRRTFDSWAIIGRCVVRAREIADRRRGGKTFMRLLDQQGITPALGRSPKTMASKLEKIMKHYAAVVAW